MPNVWTETGAATAAKHEVDPISRIEGHLGVKVAVNSSGTIIDANAHGNLWRGFENFLLGRRPNDAITFVQRICGVCPVPHGMTSAYAIDTVLGYSPGHITFKGGVSEKALLIRNLVLGAEFLMSSITHFYHLAAPSYVQGPNMPPWTPYFGDEYYHPLLRSSATGSTAPTKGKVPDANPGTLKLWDAVIISYVKALKMRRLTFEAGALFAGRMPMTSCYVAGGVTNDTVNDDLGFGTRCTKFKEIIRTVGEWIVAEYVPIAFTLGLLYQDFDSQTMAIGIETTTTMKTNNRGHGAGLGRFLSWGGFPQLDDTLFTPGGVKDVYNNVPGFKVENKAQVLSDFLGTNANRSVAKCLTEDITHARYEVAAADTAAYNNTKVAYPGAVKRTKPDRKSGYTYMKAPRWKGFPCEVGPLARLAVAGTYPVNGSSLGLASSPIYIFDDDLNTNVLSAELVAALTNDELVTIVTNWLLGLKGGLSTMDRLRARALESLMLVQAMVGTLSLNGSGGLAWANDGWIDDLAIKGAQTSWSTGSSIARQSGTWQGWGATEAPRGALMHQVTIKDNKITAYQCIVPTTWNGSPKCANSLMGAMEAAMIGAPFKLKTDTGYGAKFDSQDGTTTNIATEGGVEVLRIAQSFDPCIACAVH